MNYNGFCFSKENLKSNSSISHISIILCVHIKSTKQRIKALVDHIPNGHGLNHTWCIEVTCYFIFKRNMLFDHTGRAANLQNIISVFCWKNFRILSNFSVSLNLFLIRLKTVIMATSYLLWWDPLAYCTPNGNSSRFFRYYRNRKLGKNTLLPHVEERRLNVLVIKDVFEGFKL